MLQKLPIEDWESIQLLFAQMFDKLGEVSIGRDVLIFHAWPEYVSTSFSLGRDGKIHSSMPLHQMNGKASHVVFDEKLESISVVGFELEYTYTIPEILLPLRAKSPPEYSNFK